MFQHLLETNIIKNIFFYSFKGNQPGGNSYIVGANFRAFGGTARPIKGQIFWKARDEYTDDPPMEKRDLNTVFDSDLNTWKIIKSVGKYIKN
jgi:mannan endo-1,4-beta-mannosidase